jgi:hypothetical protein
VSLLNRSFLLSRSVSLLPEGGMGCSYDKQLDVNCYSVNGKNIPLVLLSGNLTTQSKTLSAPGDDDPDREAEICY